MIIHTCAQRSEEWHKLRLGIPTASEFHRIVTPTGKLSTQAKGLMHRLLAEWILGAPLDDPTTQWMDRGTELEDEAIRAFEFERDVETSAVGFVTTDDGLIGCSPDRFAGECGVVEIKCPKPNTHVGYMIERSLEGDYVPQLQGQLWLCERDTVEVVSYCPGLPSVIMSCARDSKYIAILSQSVRSFSDVLIEARVKLEQQYGPFARNILTPGLSDDDPGPLGITDYEVDLIVADRFGV